MKKVILKFIVVSMGIVVFLSNCKKDETNPVQDLKLKNTSWSLKGFDLEDEWKAPVEGSDLFISFKEDGQIEGTAGCNGLIGNYSTYDNSIEMQVSTASMMICDDDIMIQEQLFINYLNNVESIEQTNSELKIVSSKGATVHLLSQKD
ncbi:MAG: META domain-containing protein [Carboxylicivirga sp.]|jgi:heat shock protein HslJ|nr:META domain-containing protein [Carboxylicivirga sp.]MCT4643971.1 META domain-containing protein [Carboxylicivirga sp.]